MPSLPSTSSCTPHFFVPDALNPLLPLRPAPCHCHYLCSDFIAALILLTNFPALLHSSYWPKLSFWNKMQFDYSPFKNLLSFSVVWKISLCTSDTQGLHCSASSLPLHSCLPSLPHLPCLVHSPFSKLSCVSTWSPLQASPNTIPVLKLSYRSICFIEFSILYFF